MSLKCRFQEDSVIEIGIDEAGRGSFWGPIMAGAVVIPTESEWTEEQREILIQVRDSKKISPKKRDRLATRLKELIPLHAVGMVTAQEINEHGITWANQEAFRRAAIAIPGSEERRLLVDGSLPLDKWEGEQHLIVDGDATYLAIAASSILAKVAHDQWIQAYCEDHSECNERYDLVNSKGYGTAKHRDGIKLYGGHELHRELYIQHWLPGATHQPKSKKKSECLIRF